MAIDGKKLYEIVKRDYDLCEMAQQDEDAKAQQGDSLAENRATELNQHLAVFRANRDYLSETNPETISQEELEEISDDIRETRSRFHSLLKNPQSAGRTGEIAAEMAKKEEESKNQD